MHFLGLDNRSRPGYPDNSLIYCNACEVVSGRQPLRAEILPGPRRCQIGDFFLMKEHYFVVVLAHSLHGRLRRIHIPHQTLYLVVALALFGSVSLFGMVSSYLRMTWKVANYNTLRAEVDTLRSKYQALQRENDQKQEQLASLQLMASEVSMALGLKRRLEGADDIAADTDLLPTYKESIEEYNFLKSASFSRINHNYARSWQKNVIPSM